MDREQVNRIRNELSPSNDAMKSLFEKVEQYESKRVIRKKIVLGFVVTLSFIGTGVIANKLLPRNNNTPPVTDFEYLYGLPKNKFTLDLDLQSREDSRAYICDVLTSLIDDKISFTILKINEVAKNETDSSTGYFISATALRTISGQDISGEISFQRWTNKSTTSVWREWDVTEEIRVGGVYIIPLRNYESTYYDYGAFDVLYEIDDRGIIDSHSSYVGFNKYDGISINHFINIVTAFKNNKLLMGNIELTRYLQRSNLIMIDPIEMGQHPIFVDGKYTWTGMAKTKSCLGLNCSNEIKIYVQTDSDSDKPDWTSIEFLSYDSQFRTWSPHKDSLRRYITTYPSLEYYENMSDGDILELITNIQHDITIIENRIFHLGK